MSNETNNPAPRKPRRGYWQMFGGKFLVLSILAHVLFVMGAAYYIVQRYPPKKLTFQAGAPSTNPSKKLAEHKVQMAKKQKSMSAPAPAKRVVTTAPAKIVLPEMPAMPSNVITPPQITGIGGVGTGFTGSGGGGGGDGGGGGTGFISPFGSKDVRAGALEGRFYDLKHLSGGQDTPGLKYDVEVNRFIEQGWNNSVLTKYLKGLHKLYTTEIYFPTIDSNDAPKAFGSPKPDSPGRWVVVYRGQVSAPEGGVYHFVGAGDDDMIIRFDGKLILFNCEHINAPGGTLKNGMGSSTLGDAIYHYSQQDAFASFVRSLPVTVEAGKFYQIDILIGDDSPAKMFAKILIEKEGVNYAKDGDAPILPVFALDKVQGPAGDSSPQHTSDGPLWKGKVASTSLLDMNP